MTDSNDWRVTISLAGQAQAGRAQRSLSGHEVEEDVRRRLGRNTAVSAGDSQIFLYADAEVAAREAERVAIDVLGRDGIQAEAAVHRWHPIEAEWEDPDVAMPGTEAERGGSRRAVGGEPTGYARREGLLQAGQRRDHAGGRGVPSRGSLSAASR